MTHVNGWDLCACHHLGWCLLFLCVRVFRLEWVCAQQCVKCVYACMREWERSRPLNTLKNSTAIDQYLHMYTYVYYQYGAGTLDLFTSSSAAVAAAAAAVALQLLILTHPVGWTGCALCLWSRDVIIVIVVAQQSMLPLLNVCLCYV